MNHALTPQNIRLNIVYADPEFKHKAKRLLLDFVNQLHKQSHKKEFVDHVSNGHIWRAAVIKYGSKSYTARYDNFLDYFSIDELELINYYTQDYWVNDQTIVYQLPDAEDKRGVFTIEVYPTARMQDLEDAYRQIQRMRSELVMGHERLRGPRDIDLVYAMRKARRKKRRFIDIAQDLNEGELEGYKLEETNIEVWYEGNVKSYYQQYKKYVLKPKAKVYTDWQ